LVALFEHRDKRKIHPPKEALFLSLNINKPSGFIEEMANKTMFSVNLINLNILHGI
jgi:hypothetical protein